MSNVCPACGSREEGRFCSNCGSEIRSADGHCAACGERLPAGASFCGQCGAPAGLPPRKPAAARLPWALTGLALVAFAIGISLFVRGQTAVRAPGAPPTGGVISGNPEAISSTSAEPANGGMLSMAEILEMGPRVAGDRLFDRTMRLQSAGDAARTELFARMAQQSYAELPADEVDLDVRFHLGMLDLALGDAEEAGRTAGDILAEVPDHLLGLILAAQAAGAAGDQEARARYYGRFRGAAAAAGRDDYPEYTSHWSLVESELIVAEQLSGG